ncbi:hypothetical protein ACLB1E_17405 [Escherichia coli]
MVYIWADANFLSPDHHAAR